MITELAYLIFIAAGALAVGNIARQPFHKSQSRLEEFLVSSGLGFVIISAAFFILGALKLYITPVLVAADVVLLLLIAVQAKNLAAIAIPDISWLKDSPPISKLIFAAFVLFAALNFIASAAPPTSADALVHHLTAPKIYLSEHGIVNIPSLQLMTEAPMSVNMIYLYGLQLLNGKLAQMTAWYLSFLAALAVFMITARITTKQAAVVAATLFATMPIFSVFNVRPYVDIPLAFFALLATHLFLQWLERNETKHAVLTGLFMGMAVSAKNTGLLTGAAFAITIAVMFLRAPADKKARFAAQAAIIGVVAAAMLAPWLIKSYLNTGDPMHPFLYEYFQGTYWNNDLGRTLLEFHRSHGIGFSLPSLISFPFKITVNPQLFADTAGVTPVFLGFLPLLWPLRKKVPRQITTLLMFVAMLVVLQFFTAQQTRYMFLAWGILSIITAYIVHSFRTERLIQAGLYALVAMSLAMNAALWAAANLDDLPAAAGLQPEKEYLMKKVPTYAATEYLAAADKNGTACWYGEGRGFWAKNPYVWCNPLYQAYVDFLEIKTPQQLSQRLKEINISYVLYEKRMRQPPLYGKKKVYSDKTAEYYFSSNQLMQAYLGGFGTKIYEDNNTEVYKVAG
ncbi:glycosyltransferase family 39 protein [Candidatus Woesearchaeota archaeon]|nr:glycosyltransferase family 39 protein [Candidatus Woesearchaeota archaeon]